MISPIVTGIFTVGYLAVTLWLCRGVRLDARSLALGGITCALTLVLASLYIPLPTGSTITAGSMLPLMLLAVVYDYRLAFLTGWITGILALFLIPTWQPVHWAQIFVEHLVCFSCLGYAGTDSAIQSLLINFVKRCREDSGAKFQVILYGKEKANYEGVISIKNNVTDAGEEPGSLVYWLTGAEASCAINASCTNKIYDGEYTVNTAYKQYELEQAITDGILMFHNVTDAVSGNVEGDTRVLKDINTFTEFTKDKNEDFSFNQVIRVLDNAAIDLARLFNRTYLGKVQNDDQGRLALWNDGVALFENYQKVRAIQNFVADDLPVPTQGDSKDSVLWTFEIQPTVCMEKLYCTIYVA